MEKIVGLASFTFILIFVSPIIGVFLGAFAGWCAGLIFEETILGTLSRFGVDTDGLSMWKLGACLGFVGGYLKTSVHQKS